MDYSITAKSIWHIQDFDIALLKFDGCIQILYLMVKNIENMFLAYTVLVK